MDSRLLEQNSEEIYSPTHIWLIDFQQRSKAITWKKDVFLTNGAGTIYQKMNLDPYLAPYRINSKWITDLQVECRTIKIRGESIGGNLCD